MAKYKVIFEAEVEIDFEDPAVGPEMKNWGDGRGVLGANLYLSVEGTAKEFLTLNAGRERVVQAVAVG